MAQNPIPGDYGGPGAQNLVSAAINLTTILANGANGKVLQLMQAARDAWDNTDNGRLNPRGDFKGLAQGVAFASGSNKMFASVLQSPSLGFTSGPLNGQTDVAGFRLVIQQSNLTGAGAPTKLHEWFIPFVALDNLVTTAVNGAILFP